MADSNSSKEVAQTKLPLDVERALFIKFWTWLGIVGTVVVVITGGAWFLISTAFVADAEVRTTRAAESAILRIRGEYEQLRQQLRSFSDEAQKSFTEIQRSQFRAETAATTATEHASEARIQLGDLRKEFERSNDVFEAIRELKDITKQIASDPGLQAFVVNEVTQRFSGMTAFFINECREDDGWIEVEGAKGRFLAAVGEGKDRNDNKRSFEPGIPTDPQKDGTYKHQLTIAEMPIHNHGISASDKTNVHDGFGGSTAPYGIDRHFRPEAPVADWGILPNVIGQEGEGTAHNNIPPVFALYLCEFRGNA